MHSLYDIYISHLFQQQRNNLYKLKYNNQHFMREKKHTLQISSVPAYIIDS